MNVKIGLAVVAGLSIITVVFNWDDRGHFWDDLVYSVQQRTGSNQESTTDSGLVWPESISNGISASVFFEIFGEPKAMISQGTKQILQYHDFRATLTNEIITELPENINDKYAYRKQPTTLEKIKELPKSIPATQNLKAALAKRKAHTLLDSKNQPVDHSSLLTTGKVTVIEFYSPELEACQQVDQGLETVLAKYDQVELKKIQIDSWNSETAKQYHINSVPDIRVLDQHGFLVSQPVTRIEKVDDQIDLSRVIDAVELAQSR